MPNLITKKALKVMLKDKESFDDILKFCKSKKKICRENKSVLCKKVLQVSGYSVPKDIDDACKIFQELVHIARLTEKEKVSNILKMTSELLENISHYGSEELKYFMLRNGYDVEPTIINPPLTMVTPFSFASYDTLEM